MDLPVSEIIAGFLAFLIGLTFVFFPKQVNAFFATHLGGSLYDPKKPKKELDRITVLATRLMGLAIVIYLLYFVIFVHNSQTLY